ncbi:hypothetical protein MNV49_001010 [Pseudohyphozyma bogoriensis]|nr:hypothetical protein MNV49_001010 [Pseudohyphozyma bogoriensis]
MAPMALPVGVHSWLVSHLAPLYVRQSDAEPAVLADYVIALLANDLPTPALREYCAAQLADFVAPNTGTFVDSLFLYLADPSPSTPLATPAAPPRGTKRAAADSDPDSLPLPSTSKLPRSAHHQILPFNAVPTGPRQMLPPHPRARTRTLNSTRAAVERPSGSEPCPDYHAPFPPDARGPYARATRHDPRTLSSPTTLVVENIPHASASESAVTGFFAAFGDVQLVQVDPPRLRAVVTFRTPDQAQRALSSPDAVFGNRFQFGNIRSFKRGTDPLEHEVEFETRIAAEQALSHGLNVSGIGKFTLRWDSSRAVGDL